MVSLSFSSLSALIYRDDFTAFTSFLNNRNVALDDRDENGTTALMVAAEQGKVKFLQSLLEFGADVNISDLDHWTALHNAAKGGHVDCIRDLLKAGAKREVKDMGGWTPLMWSVYQHHTDAVELLLQHGALAGCTGQQHVTPLALASGRGDLDIVTLLLQYYAKPNVNDKFGTSPLIWACRKGYVGIVRKLLDAGANADNSGMYSWTPLLMAVKGGYAEIVDLLIDHRPNLNVMDSDGVTPLIMAARDGALTIVSSLITAGAYVNIQDKVGDTALICAARAGHVAIVELLLKKYAEINVTGKEHKTALYWAVEKNHAAVVKLLLNAHADTEIPTKDEDTALLRAVRNRQADTVQLLLECKARITASDRKADTCLHIAMRARSRRIVEILLRNPKHSKLLYRPNKAGETPYNIDMAHKPAILGDIFGARKLNTNEENENRLGYELYSGALADFLSEPSLTVPITVGLYAKWGSGKSFLLGKLTEEMRHFTQQWLEPVLEISPFLVCCLLHAALLLGVVVGIVFGSWSAGLLVGAITLLLLLLALAVVKRAARSWEQERMYSWNTKLTSYVSYARLLYQISFCRPPGAKHNDEVTNQIRFFYADRANVISAGRGDVSVVHMLGSLYSDVEARCGRLACRLFRAFRPASASSSAGVQWRTLCFVPYLFVFLWVLYVGLVTIVLVVYYVNSHEQWEQESALEVSTQHLLDITNSSIPVEVLLDVRSDNLRYIVSSLIIALSVTLGIVVLTNIFTIGRVLYALFIPHSLYLDKLTRVSHQDEDRYVDSIKEEVQLLISMVRCLDSFTGEKSRLVVVVDGMDSCEQEKVLEILDMMNMMFALPEAPFVILLSIDPHIIAKAVDLNINKAFSETAIGGTEYLRNIIHLPFYLQNAALRKVNTARKVASAHSRKEDWSDADASSTGHPRSMSVMHRRISISSNGALGSRLGAKSNRLLHPARRQISRIKSIDSTASSVASNLNRVGVSLAGTCDLNRVLLTDDYFSDVNPRSMRRLMNVIYVSGRLVKAFHIDFNWYHLASWINIIEQWPYRSTWMILYLEYNEQRLEDRLALYDLYMRLKQFIPSSREMDPLSEYDRDEKKLEVFLSFHRYTLTIADMKVFLPFTINLDPYVKKVVKDVYMEPVEGQLERTIPVVPTAAAASTAGIGRLAPTAVHRNQTDALTQRLAMNQQQRAQQLQPPPMAPHLAAAAPAASVNPLQQLQPTVPDLHAPWTWMYPPFPAPAAPPTSKRRVPLPPWCLERSLSELSVDDVCILVSDLRGITSENAARCHHNIRRNNINGWVLSACELSDLKQTLDMAFGDWEIFSASVRRLRELDTESPVPPVESPVAPGSHHQQLVNVQVTTESGSVTATNSPVVANNAAVASPGVSDPSLANDPDLFRRRGTESNLEKQVTMEDQMICGVLQTLNEDAYEDVLVNQDMLLEMSHKQPLTGSLDAMGDDDLETDELFLVRSAASSRMDFDEPADLGRHLSRSGSVRSISVAVMGGGSSPWRRRRNLNSPFRPLDQYSDDPDDLGDLDDLEHQLSVCSTHSLADLARPQLAETRTLLPQRADVAAQTSPSNSAEPCTGETLSSSAATDDFRLHMYHSRNSTI